MKKVLFLFALMAVASQLKAQVQKPQINNLLLHAPKKEPVKYFSTIDFNKLSDSLKITNSVQPLLVETKNNRLFRIQYAYDGMPIVKMNGYSKMPVARLDINSKMPVINPDRNILAPTGRSKP